MQMSIAVGLLWAAVLVAALDSPYPDPTLTQIGQAHGAIANGPEITKAPAFNQAIKRHLLARQTSLTCGFFNGDPDQPNLCETSSQCYFDPPSHYFWCGPDVNASFTTITTCLSWDGSGTNSGPQFLASGDSTTGVTCGKDYPDCRTTYFNSVPGIKTSGTNFTTFYTGPYVHFDCVSEADEQSSILFLLQNPLTQTTLADGSTSSITSFSTASSLTAPAPTPQVTITATPTATAAPSPSGGLTSGEKAGIGVGATLGALVLIAAAVGYWWVGKKREQRTTENLLSQRASQADGRGYYEPAPAHPVGESYQMSSPYMDSNSRSDYKYTEPSTPQAELSGERPIYEAPT